MKVAARVIALARRDLPFVEYLWEFCGLATVMAFDDATILSLFWHGANFHRPVDLRDTTGLGWREGILLCLVSVLPRARTRPLSSVALPCPPATADSSPEHAPVPAPRKHFALLTHPECPPVPSPQKHPPQPVPPERPQVFAPPERIQVSTPPVRLPDRGPTFPNMAPAVEDRAGATASEVVPPWRPKSPDPPWPPKLPAPPWPPESPVRHGLPNPGSAMDPGTGDPIQSLEAMASAHDEPGERPPTPQCWMVYGTGRAFREGGE